MTSLSQISLMLGNGRVRGGSGPAKALRWGATGGKAPNQIAASQKFFNSRSLHYARRQLVNPSIVIPAFFSDVGTGDRGSGGTSTFTASIEYGGVSYQATFAGSTSGVATSKSFIVSDPIPGLTITKDDAFFCRIFGSVPSGLLYIGATLSGNRAYAAGGDRLEYSATVLADRTMDTGAFTANNAVNMFRPLGILSMTDGPAVLNIGDSIDEQVRGDVDASTDFGLYCHGIGPFMGYCNVAVASDGFANFVAKDHSQRLLLAQYATHLGIGFGTNDVAGAGSLATIQASYAAFVALFPDLIPVPRTIPPRTASSDNWATGAGQTIPDAGKETLRLDLNGWYRSLPNFIEIADTQETDATSGLVTVRNGGRWKNGYTVADGGQGVHPSTVTANSAPAAQSASYMAAFGL